MYVIHRQHFDTDGKVIYSIFEGSPRGNHPIPSFNKAEVRRNEILWLAISDAQHNFIKYEVEDNSVVVHYAFGTVRVQCSILKLTPKD